MTPERTGSGIGQLIWQLCKSEKLPDPWTPAELTTLIAAYRALVKTIGAQEPTTQSEVDIDEIMQHGRPGAYDEMVKRAQARERPVKGKKKKK